MIENDSLYFLHVRCSNDVFPTYKPGLYDSINDIDVKHVVVKVVRNAVHVRTMKNTNTHTHTKRETKLWSYSCTYWNIRYTFITLLSYTLTATDGPTNPPTVCACVCPSYLDRMNMDSCTHNFTNSTHISAEFAQIYRPFLCWFAFFLFVLSIRFFLLLLLPATLSSHHYRPLQI